MPLPTSPGPRIERVLTSRLLKNVMSEIMTRQELEKMRSLDDVNEYFEPILTQDSQAQ